MQMRAHGEFRQGTAAMRFVFNGKKKCRRAVRTRDIFACRYLSQKIDGNVDVVTWAQAQYHSCRGLLFELICSRIRARSTTEHRQFRQSRDAPAPAAIRHCLFSSSVRRSINAVSCLARARERLEIALHGLSVQAILVFSCDRCHQPPVRRKF